MLLPMHARCAQDCLLVAQTYDRDPDLCILAQDVNQTQACVLSIRDIRRGHSTANNLPAAHNHTKQLTSSTRTPLVIARLNTALNTR